MVKKVKVAEKAHDGGGKTSAATTDGDSGKKKKKSGGADKKAEKVTEGIPDKKTEKPSIGMTGDKKNEKIGGKAHSTGKIPKLSLDVVPSGGISIGVAPGSAESHKLLRDTASKTSTDSKGLAKKKKKLNTESTKYIGGEPEWNSLEVRNADLSADGYTCCIVIIIEESKQLTKYTNYLQTAINTGIRRKFASIDGHGISHKVKKYMTATHQREVGLDDEAYNDRMDIWAEAVKHILLQYKIIAMKDHVVKIKQETEITGARSKELVTVFAPLLTAKSSDPALNDLESDQLVMATTGMGGELDKDKKKQGGNGKGVKKARASLPTLIGRHDKPILPDFGGKFKPTLLKKRGEIALPSMEFVDDAPQKSPHSFFLLQGFYNPILIEELRAIGVRVDGVLLMTAENMKKRNFGVIDIESKIPLTFKPRNMLPDYVKNYMGHHSMVEDHDLVAQFWREFANMLNDAKPNAEIHDVALMNCPIPSLDPAPTSLEGKGLFAASLFDETSNRIYEMLILNEWFQAYKAAPMTKELLPLAEPQSQTVYERLINQVPAECVTVPVIVECMIEQVVSTMDAKGFGFGRSKSGQIKKPNAGSDLAWGKADHRTPGTSIPTKRSSRSSEVLRNLSLPTPLYIKSCDFASMRTCHLSEKFAAHIASSQVCGDLHDIQSFLWKRMPDFNKGLYMKLLSNLNHFMHFMPPQAVKFQDMFFILHLLMAAGVELHLQKRSETLALAENGKSNVRKKSDIAAQLLESEFLLPESGESFESIQHPIAPGDVELLNVDPDRISTGHQQGNLIPGTTLKKDHDYLAVEEDTKMRFILAPTSNAEFVNVTPLGKFANEEARPERERKEKDLREEIKKEEENERMLAAARAREALELESEFIGEYHEEEDVKPKPLRRTSASIGPYPDNEKLKELRRQLGEIILTHTIYEVPVDPVNQVHGAVVATARTIHTAAEFEGEQQRHPPKMNFFNPYTLEETDNPTPPNTPKEDSKNRCGEEEYCEGAEEIISPIKKLPGISWGNSDESARRFIACEEEWFNSISDYSVLEALMACPALLAISETGALDLSSWVETYLFCSGLSRAAGEGEVIGDLANWTFVEEYVATQMIQVLSAAAKSYLCMQRIYCPFYDTLLFIFNNPIPLSLKADSHYYYKLKTLPGMQHFLEYTINEKDVLNWLLERERSKGIEVIDTFSVATLMRLVPEDQWMLIPSIKWTILREQKEREQLGQVIGAGEVLLLPSAGGDLEEEEEEEEDDEFGQLKKEKTEKVRKDSVGHVQHKYSIGGKHPHDKKRTSVSSEISKEKGNKERKGSKMSGKSEEIHHKGDKRHSEKIDSAQSASVTLEQKDESKSKNSVENDNEPMQIIFKGDGDFKASTSFNFTDAVRESLGLNPTPAKSVLKPQLPRFDCYDLGKRVLIAEGATCHLFPLDGTVIGYEISVIDPDFRMMQLSISKNSHQTFFYPYYIPDDMDLAKESYVVCPYFHMVHANGTIFAFQDLRTEDAPYFRFAMKKNYPQPGGVFSSESIHFIGNLANESPRSASETTIAGSGTDLTVVGEFFGMKPINEMLGEDSEYDAVYEGDHKVSVHIDAKEGSTKGKKRGKSGKKDKEKGKEKDEEKAEKKKGKKEKKGKRGKIGVEEENRKSRVLSQDILPHTSSHGFIIGEGEEEETGGEWRYPSSENTEAEEEGEMENWEEEEDEEEEDHFANANLFEIMRLQKERGRQFYFSWESAEKLLDPMSHSFRITFPSGLQIKVEDVKGPPLSREVKQCYLAKGSASPLFEDCRYYTSTGSVVKFMLNKSIQILSARGYTTNIRELSVNADKDETAPFDSDVFTSASKVRIYNGEVIFPTGEFRHFLNGNKMKHNPLYVFTSGVMPNGEIFRRRQDGVTYLHRHDGTTITHFPDGTRFTTRMIVLKDDVEEFEEWVFVGLKFMIEHPNYATVLFNSLSGNIHIRTTPGEWARIFADGSIKICTKDEYKLDVDKYRAFISNPPCFVNGEKNSPNLVAIKLFHSHKNFIPPVSTKKSAYANFATSYAALRQLNEAEEEETRGPSPNEEPPVESAEAVPNTKAKKNKGPRPKVRKGNKHRHQPDEHEEEARMMDANLRREPSLTPIRLSMDRKRSQKSISIEEESGEIGNKAQPNKTAEDMNPNLPSLKKLDIETLLSFTDMWTVCRAIDSWDNRFAVDIFGHNLIDKGLMFKSEGTNSTEVLVNTLSSQFQLPKQFVSGILETTSSEDFSTRTKRLNDLAKPSQRRSTTKVLPKTKIFIVRRDLSGYEYLKKSDVDKMVTAAKNCREATCIMDVLPGQDSERNPRQLITIMEPIDQQKDTPHGIWKSDYREPVFRPRNVANKHLQMARPEDLRWFGYVVASAHLRRPRFYLSPREQYFKVRKSSYVKKPSLVEPTIVFVKESEAIEVVVAGPTLVTEQEEEKNPIEDFFTAAAKAKEADEGKKKKKDSKGKKDKGKKGEDKPEGEATDKKDKKGKKKLGKSESLEKKELGGTENKSKGSLLKEVSSLKVNDRRKSSRGSGRKGSKKRISKTIEMDEEFPVPDPSQVEEGDNTKRKFINLEDAEIGEYPDLPDIEGLYGLELPEENAIKAMFHPDILPSKRAVIVRSLVEIPRVDEKMQRALLAASMSYSKTIDNHKKIYENYEMRDPRPEDEKLRQKGVKQRLIEQNLEQMHLFEQKEGNLLHFNL